MQHRRRAGVALLVATFVIGSSVAAGAGTSTAKKVKGPKVDVEDACTMLWPKRIEKALGGPVTIVPGSTIAGAAGCVATVGTDPAVAPGGTLQAFTEYPNLLGGSPNARAAVEDRRAGDALSDDEIVDVDDIGISGYSNRTKGAITILATKKFAFTLQWARAGAVELGDDDGKALAALAKNVVARFTR